MTPTTAIQRAEQWRKENACGEAAKVAIALLNELERVQALYTSQPDDQIPGSFGHGTFKFFEYEAFKEATRQVQEQNAQLQEAFQRERTKNK